MLDLWRIKNFMNQNEIVVEWSSKTLSYKEFSKIFTTKNRDPEEVYPIRKVQSLVSSA